MEDYEAKFRAYLDANRYRMTPERLAILEEVFQAKGHFTADDFLIHTRQHHPKVSRATIYRTLDLLVQSGLVDKVELGGNRAFYEYFHGRQHHDHLICLGCGSVIEFTEPEIEALQESVCRSFNFRMESHSHKIFGRCDRCQHDSEPPPSWSPGHE